MALPKRLKGMLSFVLRVGLSGALLWWLFQKIDMEQTAAVLRNADLGYITAALILFLFINGILLVRWFIFIRALDLQASILNVTRCFFIGLFCNLFLPSAIGGDVVKTLGLCKGSSQKARVVASVLLDRLSGFLSLVIIATTGFAFGFRYLNDGSLLVMIGAMAVVSLSILGVLFNEPVYAFFCRVFRPFPKLEKALMQLHYDVVLLKDKKSAMLVAVVWSCFGQILLALDFYLISRALLQDVSILYFLIFIPIVCVASSFPSIGGLGVREAGAVVLFGKVGMDAGVAASMSLMSFIFMVFVGLIGGVVYVSTISSGRIQHHPSDA